MNPTRRPHRALVRWGVAFALLLVASSGQAAPFAQIQKLVPPASDGGSVSFGNKIAVDGDFAAISARGAATTPANAGAVYLFRFDGARWLQVQKLTASDAQANDFFGSSVALDGTTLVVGAKDEDGGGSNRGAAYVFDFDGAQWVETQKLTASDALNGDNFGTAVAIKGDRLLASAISRRGGGIDRGAIYAFTRDAGTGQWSEQQILTASDTADSDFFGTSLAIAGDVAVVGAWSRSTVGPYRGGAYVFTFAGSTWSEAKKLIGSDTTDYQGFGVSLAVSANGSLLIGSNRGAYFFTATGSDWVETKKFTSADPDATLGQSAALDDATAVPGSWNGGPQFGGVAEVFPLEAGGWSDTPQRLVGSDTAGSDTFSADLALSGDFLFASATSHDSSRGAVYVFSRDPALAPPAPPATGAAPVPPTVRLATKAKIKTPKSRVTLRGASTGTTVEAAWKVGKTKRTKRIPVVGGAWKFKAKLKLPKTKITFIAVSAANLRSAPVKATITRTR